MSAFLGVVYYWYMKVDIRRIDKEIPLPAHHSEGPCGFDFPVRETTTIAPRTLGYIPLNVALRPPEGHILILASRSSTPKRGIMIANGIGIGDYSFCGNNDEYKACVYNYTDDPVTVERGDRIIQGIFVPVDRVSWNEVDDLGSPDRGGFGTTGK